MANVSGPSEFGQLHPADRQFWAAWQNEKIRRENEEAEKWTP